MIQHPAGSGSYPPVVIGARVGTDRSNPLIVLEDGLFGDNQQNPNNFSSLTVPSSLVNCESWGRESQAHSVIPPSTTKDTDALPQIQPTPTKVQRAQTNVSKRQFSNLSPTVLQLATDRDKTKRNNGPTRANDDLTTEAEGRQHGLRRIRVTPLHCHVGDRCNRGRNPNAFHRPTKAVRRPDDGK
jgi:hypothetical protein